MKKMFVVLAAVVITAGAWAYPSPSPAENSKAAEKFEMEFSGARNVEWSGSKDLPIATFIVNNERMWAWFTSDGELIATQRNVKKEQMPYLAAKAINKLEEGQSIRNIAEIIKDGEMYYLVRSENAKYKSLYKLNPAGDAERMEKRKKK